MNSVMESGKRLINLTRSKVTADSAWVTAGFATNAFASLFVSILLARLFSENNVAIYFLFFSMVIILSAITQVGLNVTVVKVLNKPKYIELRLAYLIKMIFVILASNISLSAIIILTPSDFFTEVITTEENINQYIYIVLLWVLFFSLRSYLSEVFRGFHDIKRAALYQRIFPNILLMLLLIIVYIFQLNIELHTLLISIVFINFFLICISLPRFMAYLKVLTYKPGVQFTHILASGGPIVMGQSIQFLITQSPIWILTIVSTLESVADYGVATRLAAVVSIPLLIANNVIMPKIAKLFGDENIASINKTLNVSVIASSSLSLIVTIILVIYGEWLLLLLFGEEYLLAYDLLIILCIGNLINVVSGSPAVVLAMAGFENYVMYSSFLAGILTISICFSIIPTYGAVGAAIAASIGISALNLVLVLFCYKLTDAKTYLQMPSMIANKRA